MKKKGTSKVKDGEKERHPSKRRVSVLQHISQDIFKPEPTKGQGKEESLNQNSSQIQ